MEMVAILLGTLIVACFIPRLVKPLEAGYGIVTLGAIIIWLIASFVVWWCILHG